MFGMFAPNTSPCQVSAGASRCCSLWLVIGRGVLGLVTLVREITYGLDIMVRPHLPQSCTLCLHLRASSGFAKTPEGSCENLRHIGSCFGRIGVVNSWIKHHAKRGEVWLGMIERQNEHEMSSITLRNCYIALRSCLLRRVMTSGHKSARAHPSLDIERGAGRPKAVPRFVLTQE